MAPVSDRHIGIAGTSSTAWADWLDANAAQRALDLNRLLPSTGRLVVVAPHPDDEVLTCGGLLQLHASRGGDCRIVIVTDGEASHGPASVETRAALGLQRRNESDAGMAQLGLASDVAVRLGLPDGGLRSARDALAEALASLMQPADCVVSTWHLDGHPDHETVGEVAQQVAATVGASYASAPVWMWHWATPGDPRIPWQNLRGLPLEQANIDRKLSALFEHRSQFVHRDGHDTGAVLDRPILQRAAWSKEYFFV